MKIHSILLSGLLLITLAGCESAPAGAGGGLFGGGSSLPSEAQSWDMMMLLQTPPGSCPLGFPNRGIGLSQTFLGGYFPGLRVLDTSGMFGGDVPEVKSLVYILNGPPMGPVLAKGDRVKVTFAYEADADGEQGDYFLVRIIDGDRFREPVDLRNERMTEDKWRHVQFSYESHGSSFSLWFITGLSGDDDRVMLDDVHIYINGTEVLADNLGSGDYVNPTPIGSLPTPFGFTRFPFLPVSVKGSITSVAGLDAFDGLSLGFVGGWYFTLDGMGGSSGGVSGIQLMYTEPNTSTPYYGQTAALQMRSSYIGDYQGFDSSVAPTCVERGQAIIAVNPTGNADLSGDWALQLELECADPLLNLGNDVPAFYGTTHFTSQFMSFTGAPFTTIMGDGILGLSGMTIGNAGFFIMNSATTSAFLFGVYDKTTGIFAGQISGTAPTFGGICQITSGQFVALVSPLP